MRAIAAPKRIEGSSGRRFAARDLVLVPDADSGLLESEREDDFIRNRMKLTKQAAAVSIERIRDDKVVLRFAPHCCWKASAIGS